MSNPISTPSNWTPANPSGRNARFREVLVMRALPGLGDFLCATPALRALRAGLPDARITLMGLSSTRDLVARHRHLVDAFLEFPGFPGLRETPVNLPALLELLCSVQGRFDLVVQMHGDGTISNRFVRMLGASTVACPDPVTFAPHPNSLPEPLVWLSLVEDLGLPARGEQLEFTVQPNDEVELDRVLRAAGVPPGANLAVVHVGASEASRRVDRRVLARVVEGLDARGWCVMLTGARDEAAITASVREQASVRSFDLAGRTSLGALAALLSRAGLLVTGDTGLSHLASALRTPSVVVFLASDIRRWAPLDRARHRVVDATTTSASSDVILREADLALGHARSHANSTPDLLEAERVLVVPPSGASADFEAILHRLRAGLPNASVMLLATESAVEAMVQVVDEVVPGDALRADDPTELAALLARLSDARLDAALVFTAADESALDVAYLAYLAGIPLRAGLGSDFGGSVLSPCIRPPHDLPERARERFLLDELGL
jgi:ADP-heptose:LPS heptosyltransferase